MSKKCSARETAIKILSKVILKGAYANIALNQTLQGTNLSKRDKAFVTKLVYGNLEKWRPLSYQIEMYLRKPLKKKDELLGLILRNSIYEMLYCDTPPRAAVNEGVELAGKLGHQGWRGLANGVLRNVAKEIHNLDWPEFLSPLEKACFFRSLPDWIGELWRRERGEDEALRLIEAIGTQQPLVLRTNSLKTTREALMERLGEGGLDLSKAKYGRDALLLGNGEDHLFHKLFNEGYFSIQGESSQLAALALEPKSGRMILDMCAAPGGKTTYLAEITQDNGEIYAGDIHEHKIELINESCQRLGLRSIKAINKRGELWGEEFPCYFHYILLDAPCSGLGVLSRRQDALLRKKEEDIEVLASIQRGLIQSAIKALKPGGRLVYSTCTLSERENMAQREYILNNFPMLPMDISTLYSGFDDEDLTCLKQGYVELLPYKHGTDGFFIAVFTKEEQ
ncbi:MAG: 16S rRNA (cytosine(967)-C(5))-methyltransferase RsmB [Bacillota bacterium]|nr:16S rRNA (cytosine(967)-C(5))-methyltransferase RsmB [Bacillota bacterium]